MCQEGRAACSTMLKKLERTARKGGDDDEEQQQQIADNFTPLNFYVFEQHFSFI